MHREEFVDHYEVLELSANASSETVEKVFRHLVQRLHPDVAEKQDVPRFARVVKAYETLTDPESRAKYDVEYRRYQDRKAGLIREAEATGSDTLDRFRLLSLFYAKRKRDMKSPGSSTTSLQQLLGCPAEVLEFHLWYFREKGWITREDNGLLAITAAGVDEIEERNRSWADSSRLITHSHSADAGRVKPNREPLKSKRVFRHEVAAS